MSLSVIGVALGITSNMIICESLTRGPITNLYGHGP
jgi:hypothetical protein